MIAPRHSLLVFLGAALLGGCATKPLGSTTPPPPPPQNYFSAPTQGLPMRRVAMLPLANSQLGPNDLRDVGTAFQSELNKRAVFEVTPVSPAELEALTGQRQFSSIDPLPADLLAKIRARYGAEGVLLTDITQFNSYRPVAIGVRSKLIDVSTGQIRWAFDFIYDAGSPAVSEAAKRYQKQYADPRRALPDDGGSILLSPARFARYVAAETYSSLRKTP